MLKDSVQKISQEHKDKLVKEGRRLEDAGVPYFKRSKKYLIGVYIDKALK